MRVRIHEADLVDDLVSFLRRCECRVARIDLETIDVELDIEVSPDAEMSLIRAGRCYRCGEVVAPTLSALGSALCHDCRDRDRDPRGAHRDMRQRLWAQMEIDAYLKVWLALHPGVHVSLSDAPGRAETLSAIGSARRTRRTS